MKEKLIDKFERLVIVISNTFNKDIPDSDKLKIIQRNFCKLYKTHREICDLHEEEL